MKKYRIHLNKNGFGLLEAVIAIAVLIMVITSTVTLSKMSIRSSVISLDRVKAYNLVQEGLELTREVRDTNFLAGSNWDKSFEDNGNYILSAGNGKWILLKSEKEDIPRDNTTFTRIIRVEEADPVTNLGSFGITNMNDIKKITVEVTWKEYGDDWTSKGVTYLTNWKPTF